MRLRNRFLLWYRKRQGKPMSPMKIIASAFAIIILLGTVLLTLPVGSSIGLHTHQGNCEIIHVLSGCGVCHDDGTDTAISAGMTHYCPEGHTHGIDNTGREPLVLLGILPDVK